MDELQNRVLRHEGWELIRLSFGLVLGNALVLTGLATSGRHVGRSQLRKTLHR